MQSAGIAILFGMTMGYPADRVPEVFGKLTRIEVFCLEALVAVIVAGVYSGGWARRQPVTIHSALAVIGWAFNRRMKNDNYETLAFFLPMVITKCSALFAATILEVTYFNGLHMV